MKAILVIDMPSEVKIEDYMVTYVVYHTEKPGGVQGTGIPLRPLPCKKYMRQMPSDVLEKGKRKRDFIIHRVDVDNAYAMGWNDCIEYLMTGKDADAELNDLLGEILGETE